MNVPELKELTFEEERHIYCLNGNKIPSVTTIMRPLSNAMYGSVDEEILHKAAARGTAVHNAIENYSLFGIEDIDERYEGYFKAYKSWAKEHKLNIVANEIRTYHKSMLYAGTADMIAEVDGKLLLIDFKTSASINRMLTGVQLEAYAKAFESHGFSVDGKAILHLKSDGLYEWKIYEKNDYESWEVFGSLMVVHNHIQKYKRR